jgi:hypothetical protein
MKKIKKQKTDGLQRVGQDRRDDLLGNDQFFQSDPILNTEDVMSLLQVSRRTLQNWRDQGLISFSAIHGKFYYRLSSINKMLEAHLQTQEVNYGN